MEFHMSEVLLGDGCVLSFPWTIYEWRGGLTGMLSKYRTTPCGWWIPIHCIRFDSFLMALVVQRFRASFLLYGFGNTNPAILKLELR